jgi:hypothetical protein
MGKLFLMIPNTTRSGSGTMLVQMKDLGAMIGPATLIGQGTLRGEGTTCRTSRTKCHPVMALRNMLRATCLRLHRRRATCLRLHRHLMQVAAHQTTSKVVLLATHRRAIPLVVPLATSKVVFLATKVDLLGIKVVTKVTKGAQAQLTKVATLATKVVRQVIKVATHHHLLTRVVTPTRLLHTKVVSILAMVAAAQATQAKEATRTTNEHDNVRMQASPFQSTLLEEVVCGSINQTLVAV